MRDEQHGLARLHPQLFQIDAHLLARERIERAERLVHQQQRRIVDQRAHDRGTLAHAAGQLARTAVVEFAKPDLGEQLMRARHVGLRIEIAQLELQQHIAEHVAPFEQHRALEHDAEVRLRAGDFLPVEQHAAAGVAQQPRDDAQQRALAAAGGPDDREKLALPHGQIDAVERVRRRSAAAEDLADALHLDVGTRSRARRLHVRDHPKRRLHGQLDAAFGRNSLVWNAVQGLSVCTSRYCLSIASVCSQSFW